MNSRGELVERAGWVLLTALVFSLPWEKSVWVPGVGTISRLVGMLAMAAGAATVMLRRSMRVPNLALLVALLFVAWSSLTWFWSVDPPATAARALTFVQLAGMAWLIWELCGRPRRQRQLMAAYVFGSVVASVYTFVRYALDQQTYYRRYAAAGFDPNDLGLTVALAIPMALYLALDGRGLLRWGSWGAILLAIGAVLLTASRTSLIVSLIAFAFLGFTWRESGRAQRTAGLLLLAVLALGVVRLAPSVSRQRLATLPSAITEGSVHNRTRIWKTGLKVLKGRPVAGVGSGAYPEAVKPWLGVPALAGHEYVAHNVFLSVAVETGLFGAAIFGGLLLALAAFVAVMRAPERALWSVMLAMWAVGAATLTWEHRKVTWLLFALITTHWALSFRPAEKGA